MGILVRMRAIPGIASRTGLEAGRHLPTRENVRLNQRRRILVATAELIAKRGYKGTTVSLIIKRARVWFKAFYSHFKNKEEVFMGLFEDGQAYATRVIRAAARDAGPSWPAEVEAALRTLWGLIDENPVIARACFVEALAAGPEFTKRIEESLQGLSPMLERGRNLSDSPEDLPQVLEDTLAGAVLWIIYQGLVVGEYDELQKRLPETLEFVLLPYLGPKKARAAVRALASMEEPE
jgi:AcrR family transcriptional regulator